MMDEQRKIRDYEALNADTAMRLNKAQHRIADLEATLAAIAKLPDEWMNLKGEDAEERAFNAGLHNAGYELKRELKALEQS